MASSITSCVSTSVVLRENYSFPSSLLRGFLANGADLSRSQNRKIPGLRVCMTHANLMVNVANKQQLWTWDHRHRTVYRGRTEGINTMPACWCAIGDHCRGGIRSNFVHGRSYSPRSEKSIATTAGIAILRSVKAFSLSGPAEWSVLFSFAQRR